MLKNERDVEQLEKLFQKTLIRVIAVAALPLIFSFIVRMVLAAESEGMFEFTFGLPCWSASWQALSWVSHGGLQKLVYDP